MNNYKKGSIAGIETLGLVDGPGIRTVVFFNGCKLRCLYCHNPEMWTLKKNNYTSLELVNKILKYKEYYQNNGGVTFSGGEPLLQADFLLECIKLLKENNINVALDTSGVGTKLQKEILKYVDVIILDIKEIDNYEYLTNYKITDFLKFIKILNKSNKKVIIRQVIIPNINDTFEYIEKFQRFIKQIKNIEKIEFLPYHKMGIEKYQKLNISYPLTADALKIEKINELYNYFLKINEEE